MTTNAQQTRRKLSAMESFVMAVGGMIGGGIFSVLGLVVEITGNLAPLSFLIAGVLTTITACSYAGLYEKFKTAGGSIAFVRSVCGNSRLAGHLGWALILGYIFTSSLYAFTFAHYLTHVFAAPDWVANASALGISIVLLLVNLIGIGESATTAVVTVWGKLAILGVLAALGIYHFAPSKFGAVTHYGPASPLIAAAVVFIAFEGFQLLAYDVDDMVEPQKNLRPTMLWAVATVTFVYVAVSVSALMLVSEQELLQKKEIALAIAGKNALGPAGLWMVTVGALFASMSAINATLFGTARLAAELAETKELPSWFAARTKSGVPHLSVTFIAVAGGIFALLGTIERIVTFASLVFLVIFAVVNMLYCKEATTNLARLLAGLASAGLAAAFVTVVIWLAYNERDSLLLSICVALVLGIARYMFLSGRSNCQRP